MVDFRHLPPTCLQVNMALCKQLGKFLRLCWWQLLNTSAKGTVRISVLFDLLLTNREELWVNVSTGSSWAAEITRRQFRRWRKAEKVSCELTPNLKNCYTETPKKLKHVEKRAQELAYWNNFDWVVWSGFMFVGFFPWCILKATSYTVFETLWQIGASVVSCQPEF